MENLEINEMYSVTQAKKNLLFSYVWESRDLMGHFCSYLLPWQDGATFQIMVNGTCLLVELDLLLEELLVHQLHVLEPLAVEGVDLGEEGVGERVGALPHLGHLRLTHLALRLHTLELFPLANGALQNRQMDSLHKYWQQVSDHLVVRLGEVSHDILFCCIQASKSRNPSKCCISDPHATQVKVLEA